MIFIFVGIAILISLFQSHTDMAYFLSFGVVFHAWVNQK